MKKIIFCTNFIFLLFCSCSDFLDQEPDQQVSIDEQLSTLEGVQQALNGAYETLESVVSGESYFLFADTMTGNTAFTPSIVNKSISEPNAFDDVYPDFIDDKTTSDLGSFYTNSYRVINEVNLILEYVDQLSDASQQQKDQIKSEATAIRGFSHFLLVQLYGRDFAYTADASHLGIVYNTSTLQVGVDFPSRSTVSETYDNIINDMLEALSLNTGENALNYSNGIGGDYSYFNEYVIKGLLARIYLQQNNWEKAEEYANDVINNSRISLMTQTEYVSQWSEPNLPVSEVVFELTTPFDDEDGIVSSTIATFFKYISDTDYGTYTASEDLLNLFEDNDVRGQNFMFFTQSLETLQEDGTTAQIAYYFTHKFQDNAGTLVMRLSELYLIRAEAKARQGNLTGALDDVNMIRERAGASLIQDTSSILETIFDERRRELYFEGFYFYDIARYHKNIERDYCISNTCSLNYTSNYFILPIPQSNINSNQNIIQNEGY
ncbi:hypothetical protein UJ101_01929 [Flavobacteriaceae bacterium UJ101]|nr:hypothetical protein UJ101_01929 [Flavobacteriaceae bacterium UJ101]